MIRTHVFYDKDIEGVTIDEGSINTGTLEILIKPGTEAILIGARDAHAIAQHFGLIPAPSLESGVIGEMAREFTTMTDHLHLAECGIECTEECKSRRAILEKLEGR